jgi:hypothetical protein
MVKRTPELYAQVIAELIKAIDTLDPPPDLSSIVGSWGDTLDDDEVLELLIEFNR